MNIFFIDEDPIVAAKYYCSQHMKIRLEILQLFCTTLRLHKIIPSKEELSFLPASCYTNHPTRRWLGESAANVEWVEKHMWQLIEQYKLMYGNKSQQCETIFRWLSDEGCLQKLKDLLVNEGKKELTPIRLAMYSEIKEKYGKLDQSQGFDDYIADLSIAVQAYREYYILKEFKDNKPRRYTNVPIPEWFTGNAIAVEKKIKSVIFS